LLKNLSNGILKNPNGKKPGIAEAIPGDTLALGYLCSKQVPPGWQL
jgi:hypothetical protein